MNQIYMDDHITLGHNLLSITDAPFNSTLEDAKRKYVGV